NTMKELEAHYQYPILEKLSSEKISVLLSLLPSNHASAILREYKDPEKLVQLIPNPRQDKIRMQLGYDPGTAGAWMDTDFFIFSSKSSCSECLSYLRIHPLPPESVFYIYIENDKQEFIGVVSIRSVIMSDPDTPLETLMKKNLIALSVQTPKVDVANLMSRYHLLALPVVNDQKKIAGVIKIYDVLASTLEYPI
ncbi:MAG: CBS domain-containing protein, partial [Caldisericia bacterium]|nr:CBS domain-containing protein [Caldisericia bacterium]